jgi:hypothetical protein
MMTSSISPIKDVEEAYQEVLQAGADYTLTGIFGTEMDKAMSLADRAMELMKKVSHAMHLEDALERAAFTLGLATGWEARERHRRTLMGEEYDQSGTEVIDPDSFNDELAVLLLRLNNWMGVTSHPFIPRDSEMKEEDKVRTEKARQCMAESAEVLRRAETMAFVRVVMMMPEDKQKDLLENGAMHYPDLHNVLQSLLTWIEEEQGE